MGLLPFAPEIGYNTQNPAAPPGAGARLVA
jgi:hypothetical protein